MTRKGPRIELIVSGPDLVEHDLTELAERARNARPVMAKVMRRLVQAQQQQFETEGGRGGQRWKPKKDATKARQAREGRVSTKAEHFRGDLEESLTREAGGGNAIRRTSKQAATFGTRLYYAGFRDATLINFTRADTDWIGDAISSWLLHGDA